MAEIWKVPPSGLRIFQKEIHIWRTTLDLPIISIQKLRQTLSVAEQMRAERFHFEKDRKRFIAGRGILRTILGCYLNVEPSRLQFCYGKNGKPALVDTLGKGTVLFNMSDSERLALYAFNRDYEIGVDIEHIRDIPEMDQIAEQFFSQSENKILCSLPDNEKKEAFFSCWTRKEAFLKATGEGLSRPLSSFDVSLVPGQPASLLRVDGDLEAASRWSLKDLNPAFGFAAALATEGGTRKLHCWEWLS